MNVTGRNVWFVSLSNAKMYLQNNAFISKKAMNSLGDIALKNCKSPLRHTCGDGTPLTDFASLFNADITPTVQIAKRIVEPAVHEQAVLRCTVRNQHLNGVSTQWLTKQKSGLLDKVSTGHNHVVEKTGTGNSSSTDLFAVTNLTLKLKYSFDFIREMMVCEVDKNLNNVICLAEYICMAEYLPLATGIRAQSSAFIKYNFGKFDSNTILLRFSCISPRKTRAGL